MTDRHLQQLLQRKWPYSEADPGALREIGRRVADVGSRRGLVHYSDLVRGLPFKIPHVDQGAPFELGIPTWRDLDRAILGDFLGRLSLDSYQRGRFLASALVTAKGTDEPSEGFWALVSELDLFTSSNSNRRLLFWTKQVDRAHNWYVNNVW
jgi:hypothetical protein